MHEIPNFPFPSLYQPEPIAAQPESGDTTANHSAQADGSDAATED